MDSGEKYEVVQDNIPINIDNRKFSAVSNSEGGEVNEQTIFHYRQRGDLIWATYSGGNIKFGTITGKFRENGFIEFAYQHLNNQNEIMTGKVVSKPEILEDGRIRFQESWQWTCKDYATGESIVEEIP
ncbi:n-acetylglutamate synthase [Bacteroidota bacterium]